jgi:hypothetical protein
VCLLGSLLQAGFVLLKRDPDNRITTYNLTTELSLACANLAISETAAAKNEAQTIALSFDVCRVDCRIARPSRATILQLSSNLARSNQRFGAHPVWLRRAAKLTIIPLVSPPPPARAR